MSFSGACFYLSSRLPIFLGWICVWAPCRGCVCWSHLVSLSFVQGHEKSLCCGVIAGVSLVYMCESLVHVQECISLVGVNAVLAHPSYPAVPSFLMCSSAPFVMCVCLLPPDNVSSRRAGLHLSCAVGQCPKRARHQWGTRYSSTE